MRKKEGKRLFAMKSLNKSNVKRRNQVEHTRTERRVLGRAKHPFIVHLHYAFQTSQKLYFVLDYCPGGELFFHLSRMEKFEPNMARYYCAEITLALEHLHDLGVVYRYVLSALCIVNGSVSDLTLVVCTIAVTSSRRTSSSTPLATSCLVRLARIISELHHLLTFYNRYCSRLRTC